MARRVTRRERFAGVGAAPHVLHRHQTLPVARTARRLLPALPRVGELTVALPQGRRSLRVRRLDAARLRARVCSRIRVNQDMDSVGEDARGDQQNHDDSIPRFWHGHQPPPPIASAYEQKAPSPQGPGASAPATGFEPVTVRLTVGCSAVELRRIATREDISRAPPKLASQKALSIICTASRFVDRLETLPVLAQPAALRNLK